MELPLPDEDLLDVMEEDVRGLPCEDLGSVATECLYDEVEVFAYHLEVNTRGTRRRVQELWQEDISRWE